VVSINRNTNTVSMISLPRDLYVYIPNWGMQRLNQAYWYGEAIGWTDGGWGMMRQTILYNFGIETHYYAMVDFDGFEEIVDAVGGVTIAVDCPILDDICVENCDDGIAGNETWDKKVIDVGVHHMDGDEALWYARSRENTIDFDGAAASSSCCAPSGPPAATPGSSPSSRTVDQMTSVCRPTSRSRSHPAHPAGAELEPNSIEPLLPQERRDGRLVAGRVTNVQLPHRTAAMQRLVENSCRRPRTTGSCSKRADRHLERHRERWWDIVATDRLAWEGFAPHPAGLAAQTDYADTVIYDYTGNTKGSSLNDLVKLLNIKPENVFPDPDPNRTVDFEIILGANYNSCVNRQWIDPATMN